MLLKEPVMVAGYPATNGFNGGTLGIALATLKQSKACDNLNQGHRIHGTACYHSENGSLVSTIGGMSGGPVWAETNGEFVLVAIHVGKSRAILLTEEKVEWIAQAEQELAKHCD